MFKKGLKPIMVMCWEKENKYRIHLVQTKENNISDTLFDYHHLQSVGYHGNFYHSEQLFQTNTDSTDRRLRDRNRVNKKNILTHNGAFGTGQELIPHSPILQNNNIKSTS